MWAIIVLTALVALSHGDERVAGNAAVVDEFCQRYNQMSLCHLHGTLEQALTELSFLFGEDAAPEGGDPLVMAKRKSAFVRFGKRAVEDLEQAMEKRKSAFVRFGRSLQPLVEEKRKSSYVRFG